MRVAVRTDAAIHIGTGHVMRCLALADQLRESGVEVRFVCREHSGHLCSLIEARGYVVARLSGIRTHEASATAGRGAFSKQTGVKPRQTGDQTTAGVTLTHAHWLGVDWQTDAQETATALCGTDWDWLIVDHYALDRRWQMLLKPYYGQLMVIDDLAAHPHGCDLLLDQNLGRMATDYTSLVSDSCRVLVGPKYALLRAEFNALREYSLGRRARPQLRYLLISMGGIDQHNATGRVLTALHSCALAQECRITVVMGGQSPWLKAIVEQATTMRWQTRVVTDVTNMAQLMAESDLAIGAAGSTSWERCCLGLPTLMLVVAANQEKGAICLEQSGATINMGPVDDFAEQLKNAVQKIRDDPALLRTMSAAAAGIVEGRGTQEVAQHLFALTCSKDKKPN